MKIHLCTVGSPYHYADNDPLNKTDPLGLRPTECAFAELTCEEREAHFESTLDRILGGDLYPHSSGTCVNGSAVGTLGIVGAGVTAFGCIMRVGGDYYATGGGGGEFAISFQKVVRSGVKLGTSAVALLGKMWSNAATESDLRGSVSCHSFTAGWAVAAGVELCLGMNGSSDFNDKYFIFFGVGIGRGVSYSTSIQFTLHTSHLMGVPSLLGAELDPLCFGPAAVLCPPPVGGMPGSGSGSVSPRPGSGGSW